MKNNKISILIEMRPALDGFSGIPQEVRLLFHGLNTLEETSVEGLIQHSYRILSPGSKRNHVLSKKRNATEKNINIYSRFIVSLAERPYGSIVQKFISYFLKKTLTLTLFIRTFFGVGWVLLSRFESAHFKDFIWRTFFSKTLLSEDVDLVTKVDYLVCQIPWGVMHRAGLFFMSFGGRAKYPMLSTRGIDIFIAQTPYPGRVSPGTQLVVRYHDAIPVFMPQTVSEKSVHQATHFHALMGNFYSGAYFVCVSEATRRDLLKIIPKAEGRSLVIHNIVSDCYFRRDLQVENLQIIIKTRLNRDEIELVAKKALSDPETFFKRKVPKDGFRYLLIVSTLEPRKNHLTLVSAWEVIKGKIDPGLKLIIVGEYGWDWEPMAKAFKPWLETGDIFMLSNVPAVELQALYRHAKATVCPSFWEGFNYSGVESMASGGITIASDIPVHREVYGDAAEYFDPYSIPSLVETLKKVLYEVDSGEVQSIMRSRGLERAQKYRADRILPQWRAFLKSISSRKID